MDFSISVRSHVPQLFIDFSLLSENQKQIHSVLDTPQDPHHSLFWEKDDKLSALGKNYVIFQKIHE